MHTYTHTCTHTHTHMHTHAHTYTHTLAHTHTRTCTCPHIHTRTQDGYSAIDIAACSGHEDIVELLLDVKTDPDLNDEQLLTCIATSKVILEAVDSVHI